MVYQSDKTSATLLTAFWNIGIWCEPAQNIMGVDNDGDGVVYDRNEGGEHSGVEAKDNGGSENE